VQNFAVSEPTEGLQVTEIICGKGKIIREFNFNFYESREIVVIKI